MKLKSETHQQIQLNKNESNLKHITHKLDQI